MKTDITRNHPHGFTLMELIVSMSILTIILLLSLQVTETSRNAIRIAENKSVNDAIARRAFDPVARDLAQIVIREDARIEFESKPGNDKIAFLTTCRGLTTGSSIGDRTISLVTYTMESSPSDGELLVRGSLGHNYDDAATDSLSLDPAKSFPPIPTPNLQTVSNNLLRFEVEYLIAGTNGITRETAAPATSEQLRAIIITLATMDDRSLRPVRPGRMATVAAKFTDAITTSNTLDTWTRIRDDLARSGMTGFPKDSLAGIRCYQRTFLIP